MGRMKIVWRKMETTEPFDFSEALRLIKLGKLVSRLSWGKKSVQRKVKIGLDPNEGIGTWYLNFYSDRGVLSTDDILATDWVEVE